MPFSILRRRRIGDNELAVRAAVVRCSVCIQRSPTLLSSTARRQRFALYQQCRIKALLALACRRKWGLIVLMQQVEECDIEAAGELCE